MQLSPGKSKQCDEDVTRLPIETKKCQIEMPNWSAKLDCQIGTKMLNWNAKLNCDVNDDCQLRSNCQNCQLKPDGQKETKLLIVCQRFEFSPRSFCERAYQLCINIIVFYPIVNQRVT